MMPSPIPLRSLLVLLLWLSLLVGPAICDEAGADNIAARIDHLRQEIARHAELYFRKAAPEISDEAYDRLRRELEELLARRPDLTVEISIGDDRQAGFARRSHRVRMLSLDKVYSDDALERFVAELPPAAASESPALLVEPKLDGAAVSLTYIDGELAYALSRGNGEEGDDVTVNVRAIANVPAHLHVSPRHPFPAVLEVRGEVVLAWAEFERLNHERDADGEPAFAHPRNVAAGSLRLADPDAVAARGLEFVAHSLGACEPAASRPGSL